MRKMLMLGLLACSALLSAGCYTPAYSPGERHAQIFRNADYVGKQATDDWDSILLLRPATHMTIWNLR